jgi:O-antigen/teichoic acid export membrane protein
MSEGGELSRLLSSAGLVLVGGLVSAGSRLAERVIIGRALSPDLYGELSVGIAILTFSTTLALAGLSQGVPRFTSRYESETDRRGVWFTGLVMAVPLALLAVAVLGLFAESVSTLLFEEPDSDKLLYLFIAAIPFIVGQRIAIGGIRGHENTIYRTYTKDLLYPIGRIVLIVVLLALGFGITAAGYAYLIAAVVTSFAAHILLNRLIPLVGPVETYARELLIFSLPLIIATALTILLSRTDTLMLALFRSSYEVGQYNAAYPVAGGLLVVLSAFGFMYLPVASRLDAEDEREEVDRVYTVTTKWVYIVTFPAFLVFVTAPADIMRVFFGPSYIEAAPALPILSIGFFLSAAVGRNRETLSALGETQYIMVANLAGFVLNVVLNLLLIPRFGFVGAAVTSALSYALVHGIVVGTLAYRHGITPTSPKSLKTFVALPAVLLPVGAISIGEVVPITTVTLLPVIGLVGLASVGVVMLIGGLEPEDLVVVEFVEDIIGNQIPIIRHYIPKE